MLNISTEIRGKYFDALKDFEFKGTKIPIFDEIVRTSTSIPTIDTAEVYILIQDQQEVDYAFQSMCNYTIDAMLTIKVVTKFQGNGSKKLCEDIAVLIDSKIRDGRNKNKIGIRDVKLQVSRTITENSTTSTAYQKVMIYSNVMDK